MCTAHAVTLRFFQALPYARLGAWRRVLAYAPLKRCSKLQTLKNALQSYDRVDAHCDAAENDDCDVCCSRAW